MNEGERRREERGHHSMAELQSKNFPELSLKNLFINLTVTLNFITPNPKLKEPMK